MRSHNIEKLTIFEMVINLLNLTFIFIPMTRLLSTFLFTILVFSCNNKKLEQATKINPEFGNYISAFTSGIVSKYTTIRIRMANPSDYISKVKDPKSLFDFSPSISGSASWIDEQTIEFVPENILTQNQLYKVRFQLHKLMADIPEDLRIFEFDFKTLQQHINVEIDEFKTYNKKDST